MGPLGPIDIGEWEWLPEQRRRARLRNMLFIAAAVAFVAQAVAWFYAKLLYPRQFAWGANEDETHRMMPGDGLVPLPKWEFTSAITIYAPPERVWPWLVQMGFRRGGWYSYGAIQSALGVADLASDDAATRIIPELQNLKVGDTVLVSPNRGFTVHELESFKSLVLLARVDYDTGRTFEIGGEGPEGYVNLSWSWLLEPVNGKATRLVTRGRIDYSQGLANSIAFGEVLKLINFVMSRKMLMGIRQRAESVSKQRMAA